MTKRELLLAQIRTEKQWLTMLTSPNLTKEELGLPNYMSRRQAINDALDRILAYRAQLNQIDDAE